MGSRGSKDLSKSSKAQGMSNSAGREKQEAAAETEAKDTEAKKGNENSTTKGSAVDTSSRDKDKCGGAMETSGETYVESVVAKASEFGDNEMREVDIGDSKALLVRQNGEFSAIGHKCTHYGAPLVKGHLGNGRVRCPWHGACFNTKNGDIEEFPGLDGVPCFQVKVQGDDVVIKADKASLANFRRPSRPCSSPVDKDARNFLIIGGGPASVACAETLRQEGFKGRVTILSQESALPYDRPKLSKAMHMKAEEIILRAREFYQNNNIEVLLGKEVTGLDLVEKKVKVGEESFSYDKLLIATGSKPRALPVPGFQSENVFLLRKPSEANQIAELAAGKKVVVIGTSFIGMEVAAYLSNKVASISCIDVAGVPFERVLGERVGKMLQSMHEENGVKFYLGSGVKEIVCEGEGGKVSGVVLPSGETLEADIVVAGVGVLPATDFLKESGLALSRRGEVIVDKHLQASGDVFGAGDIVRFPLPLIEGDTNIGHWQIAHNHGRVAARNMLNKEEEFKSIPYFWTVQYGKSVRYCGHALSWDEIIYDGSPEERKFAAYYIKDDKVLAVSSLNFDPVVSIAAELMYEGRMPSGTQIKANLDLKSYL